MNKNKIKIELLPNYYLTENRTFDKDNALKLCGKIAGVCYDKEGFKHLENESEEKTLRRVNMTINNGHHSVYDHINISFNIQNIPKILAMIINNEHQYTTSEKSARYTPVIKDDFYITELEENLYNKWVNILNTIIKTKYGNILKDNKINKLAMENARYMVTVFMPTQMVYTTSLRQINYIASWIIKYINEHKNNNNDFDKKLIISMNEFITELEKLNVLDERLMNNEKCRSISLFGEDLSNKEDYFGYIYTTTYKASFAELAQAQRHRTIDYKINLLNNKEYFIPPIIKDNSTLVEEWLNDINSVKNVFPTGELILVNETGKYEDFILKCKERLCTSAQLEIAMQTRETLLKYQKSLIENNDPLKNDIKKYTLGARCTFPDFKCSEDCNFKEGKTLIRKI